MASAGSPGGVRVYAALLRLYPQPFQKQYSGTMQQTFADLLEAEPRASGRLAVWMRTLADVPVSAAREHITNGKDYTMNRTTKYIITGACAAVIAVGAASFWEGSLHARNDIGVEKVTVAELADAMQQDHFYNTYGDAAVLFTGKVTTVQTQQNASLVTFATGRPYALICQFPKAVALQPGQTISVAAPAGSAERQHQGVLLHDCLEN